MAQGYYRAIVALFHRYLATARCAGADAFHRRPVSAGAGPGAPKTPPTLSLPRKGGGDQSTDAGEGVSLPLAGRGRVGVAAGAERGLVTAIDPRIALRRFSGSAMWCSPSMPDPLPRTTMEPVVAAAGPRQTGRQGQVHLVHVHLTRVPADKSALLDHTPRGNGNFRGHLLDEGHGQIHEPPSHYQCANDARCDTEPLKRYQQEQKPDQEYQACRAGRRSRCMRFRPR